MLKSTIFFVQCVLIVFVNFVWLSEAEPICDDNKIVNDNYTISNVEAKYNKGINVKEIFKWIHSCQMIENQITGYNILYKQIAEQNENAVNEWTLKFAKVLIPLLQDPTIKLDKPYSTRLSELFYKIPKCVIALAFGDYVSIESVKYHEYLVASELKENGSSNKRNVFFKNLTETDEETDYADTKWKPKIAEYLNGAFLELESPLYRETLVVSYLTNNYGEHIVYTSVYKFMPLWILVPVDKTGKQCVFLSPLSNQYLCAYDEKFYDWTHYRRIFTTNSKSVEDPACHFIVN